jgi:hypothetical protein
MHVIVPLHIMSWGNTLVYSCECGCFCFVLPSYLVNVFFSVLCCLMFIDMFRSQMQLMQRLDHGNEYVCMNVFIYLFIPVMGLSNNCSNLTVMSTFPFVDYFFPLSMEMTKCERVQGMHVIQRAHIVMNLWCKDKDTFWYATMNQC